MERGARTKDHFPAGLGRDMTRTRESGLRFRNQSFVAFDRDKMSEGVSNNNEKKGVFRKPDIMAIGRKLIGYSTFCWETWAKLTFLSSLSRIELTPKATVLRLLNLLGNIRVVKKVIKNRYR